MSREFSLGTLSREIRFDKTIVQEGKRRKFRLRREFDIKSNRQKSFNTHKTLENAFSTPRFDYEVKLTKENPFDVDHPQNKNRNPHKVLNDTKLPSSKNKKPVHTTVSSQATGETHRSNIKRNQTGSFKNALIFKANHQSTPFGKNALTSVTGGESPNINHVRTSKGNKGSFKSSNGLAIQLKSQIYSKFAQANEDQNLGVKATLDSARTVDSAIDIKRLLFKKQMKKKAIKAVAKKEAAKITASKSLQVIMAKAKKAIAAAAVKAGAAGSPVLLMILMIAMFFSIIGGCGGPNLVAILAAYPAEDKDIHDASLYVTELEAELQKEILEIETLPEWAGIDEFMYHPSLNQMLNSISHDPFEMMAYLSAMYQDFEFHQVQSVIARIHEERYDLSYEVEVQQRERLDAEGNVEYYEWKILHTSLTALPLSEVIMPEIDANPDKKEMFDIYMELKGLHQAVANPFDYDWTGGISSIYGYRIDPIAGADIQLHRGLDIPNPTGTPIAAGFNGKVKQTGSDSIFGNYIIITDAKGDYEVKYAHCDTINLSQGETIIRGQTILATVGNTGASTGSHVHIEVKYKGEYLNPIFMVDYSKRKNTGGNNNG